MKSMFLMITCLLTSVVIFSQSSIEGIWQPEGKDAIFKIYEENGKFYGQLIGSNNKDEDKKIKEQESIVLLRDLQEESSKTYCCGTFISPKNKKKASASLKLKDEDTIILKVKKGWFSKSIIWTRI
ncbi:DUF2147 domain-containing protein [Polaribacter sp. M15]